jgi:peptidoglycan hydrolase-like protein with peptidoglycan-binding domain
VPQVHGSLRRLAALAVTLVAVLGCSVATAAAADGTAASGGATPEAQAPALKKVTTRQVQKALGIKADGKLGPKTRRAIKRFQKAHGLKADGIAGPATLEALGLTGTRANGTLDSASTDTDTAAAAPAPSAGTAAVLAQLARCESGGDPTAISANGTYRGKYQFSQATWEALGGTGDPAAADEATQDALAGQLYEQRGLAPWPACSAQVTTEAEAAT